MDLENSQDTTQDRNLLRATCKDLDFATELKFAARQHIESFNFACTDGLQKVVQYLQPLEITPVDIPKSAGSQKEGPYFAFKRMKIWFQDVKIG